MLSVLDSSAVAALRALLRSAGYTSASVKRAIGADNDGLFLSTAGVRVAVRHLAEGTPLNTLIKLFLLGVHVDADAADLALMPLGVERHGGTGLVEQVGAKVRATVRLVPSGGLILACDWRPAAGSPPARDHVLGVSESSVRLANLTVRRPVESALDMGTGGGVQAFLLARHTRHVIATDLNPRALEFARFNALLNAVENVEWRTGTWFEPVAGRTFDLIASNPPFVISPESELLFRDGGERGDGLSRRLIQELPAYMNEGGLASILVSWGYRLGEHWSAPLLRWVEKSGCDAWFIHDSSADPLAHAASWNSDLESDPDRHGDALDRWAEYVREEGFQMIGYGGIILRKRAGENWRRIDDVDRKPVTKAGEQIAAGIDAEDWLAGVGGSGGLLDQRLELSPSHHIEETRRVGPRGYEVDHTTIVMDGGVPLRHEADALCLALLSAFDGQRTVGEAIEAAGAQTDELALSEVQELIRLGIVVAAS